MHLHYEEAGTGVPVVLLHAWALGYQSYRETVRPLVAMGCRVFIPALPGFGGTAGLPGDHVDLAVVKRRHHVGQLVF